HHRHGDRLPDPALWLQPVLLEGHRAERHHDGRYIQLGGALHAGNDLRAHPGDDLSGPRYLAAIHGPLAGLRGQLPRLSRTPFQRAGVTSTCRISSGTGTDLRRARSTQTTLAPPWA